MPSQHQVCWSQSSGSRFRCWQAVALILVSHCCASQTVPSQADAQPPLALQTQGAGPSSYSAALCLQGQSSSVAGFVIVRSGLHVAQGTASHDAGGSSRSTPQLVGTRAGLQQSHGLQCPCATCKRHADCWIPPALRAAASWVTSFSRQQHLAKCLPHS